MLSVIIPTYNEEKNLPQLMKRLNAALSGFDHELLFVDDRSQDKSVDVLSKLARTFARDHIRILSKKGKQGKASSILEGVVESKGDIIAMIDADLQYPPEAIPEMIDKLSEVDIVVANRKQSHISLLRKITSRTFSFVFGNMVLNLPYDVQSGLKVFRRVTLNGIKPSPTPWGFDYDFLFKAARMGWHIGEVDIEFSERKYGHSNVDFFTAVELAWGAIALRVSYFFKSILKFLDDPHRSERFGVDWRNQKDFLFAPEIMSAKKTIYAETVSLIAVLVLAFVGLVYAFHRLTGISILVTLSGIMALFYAVMMFFKLRVIYHANQRTFLQVTPEELESVNPYDLPMYTILIPLRNEAEVMPQIIKAMSALDYPPEKLDIIITLEEYDQETLQAFLDCNPPSHFKTLILPDVLPKTKPKALNVAFRHIRGEFVVIYDAEIIPDTDQLKKAIVAFNKHPELDVLQTRLDHYNPDQSLVTRLFNQEFAFHFDMLLPGLQKLGYPIPLSGHSVHFRKGVLEDIGAWDPYNVTEDADTGIKIARAGGKVEILDSTSREEATTSMSAWVNQRTRWIKGFIQTSIVHLRHPIRFKKEVGIGWPGLIAFGITVPASVIINITNLFFWGLLIGWFTTHSHYIQEFFPGPIFYVSLVSFVVGNLVFVYLNLISSYNRGRYDAVKYGLLSPFYWILLAVASIKASIEFVFKPHHWSKTVHGKHLIPEKERAKTYVIRTTQTES